MTRYIAIVNTKVTGNWPKTYLDSIIASGLMGYFKLQCADDLNSESSNEFGCSIIIQISVYPGWLLILSRTNRDLSHQYYYLKYFAFTLPFDIDRKNSSWFSWGERL